MNLDTTLTKREDQIAIGVVLGLCKKEVADELNISTRTVEAIVRNAIKKIDGKKSVDLAIFWMVKHFSIPADALPKSITAFIFLIIWIPFEFTTHSDAIRVRGRRVRTEESRIRTGRKTEETNDFTIEF
jgi:DNA-binding CsgD family transcriptional regulator